MGQGTYEETVEAIMDLEAELSLFDLEINQVPVWEWIRGEVARSILTESGLHGDFASTGGRRLSSAPRVGWLWLRNVLRRNPLRAPQAERLYWGHQRRRRLEDGYWWDPYCDPIHEHLSEDYVHVENPDGLHHHRPARTRRLRYLDLIQFTGTMAEAVPGIGVELSRTEADQVTEISSAFYERFDLDLDLLSLIEGRLTRRKYTRPLYRRLLNRVDPEIVILVVGYAKETFIEVCKELNIVVIELQHGSFGPDHFGYSFPGRRTKKTFPHHFLTFGEFWSQQVDLPIPGENIHPVGFPFLESRAAEYHNLKQTDGVIFVSQASIGAELTKFAVEYAGLEDANNVTVKLHPAEYCGWREAYPWLRESDVRVVDGDDPPLYQLLSTHSVQVGVYSTVLFEGLYFELDTYVLDLPGASRMTYLLDGGHAELVETVEDLQSHIRSRHQAENVDPEFFFRSNALKNVERTLERIQSVEAG